MSKTHPFPENAKRSPRYIHLPTDDPIVAEAFRRYRTSLEARDRLRRAAETAARAFRDSEAGDAQRATEAFTTALLDNPNADEAAYDAIPDEVGEESAETARLRKAAKKADRLAVAAKEKAQWAEVELSAAVKSHSKKWAKELAKEAEEAIYKAASARKSLELATQRINASVGLLHMLAGHTRHRLGIGVSENAPAFGQALGITSGALGGVSEELRDLVTHFKAANAAPALAPEVEPERAPRRLVVAGVDDMAAALAVQVPAELGLIPSMIDTLDDEPIETPTKAKKAGSS